jgi:hypothetical protein
VAQLAGERIWQVLDQARGNRNTGAHGGVVSRAGVERRIATLEALLSDAEQALASGFEDIDLARVDQGRRTGGLHIYPRAQRLRGPNGIFDEFELRTRVDLESGHLVFVGRDVPISSVLTLVPLVRVGGASTISRNACYFFNKRVGDNRFTYISYHFEDEPELVEVEELELRDLLVDLTAH